MVPDIAICTKNLGKCYQIYEQPIDRLKQSLCRGKKQFFKEFWALNNATFEIRKGETVGIIGSNGSGKSTLLQLICGILSPSRGELKISGRIAALLELGAGFNPEFTGQENVLMNAAIMGLSRAEIEACYDDIVAFADIGDFIDQPVKTYSSGMYVRLAFATAINVSPDILVVDEALSVGDIRFQQKCMAKIKQFCEQGTVIFVSHDTTALTELCSRAIWIEGGEIQMDGQPKFVVEKYLEYMYEGEVSAQDDLPLILSADGVEDHSDDTEDEEDFLPVDSNIRQFGNKSVTIEKVRMHSAEGGIGIVYSGKKCEFAMILKAHSDIVHPIVGFFVKDRLGREIIGDNTTLMGQSLPPLSKGQKYRLVFQINQWPNLCEGDYALSIAVADGSMEDHVQCHWLHDVIIFKSVPTRMIAGIFSVLSTDIQFYQVNR